MTDRKHLVETQPIGFPADLSMQSYVSFIRNISLPAMVFDERFTLLGINGSFQKVFQLTHADIQARSVQGFFGLATWDQLRLPVEETAQSNPAITSPSQLETEFERNGKFFKLTLTTIKNPQSKTVGFLLFFIDMTREKMLEQVRADFTSMIVHDLRSPLTAVMGNLELLSAEFGESSNPETLELFQDSLDQSQRLLNLINDLLDISKIESGKFDLNREWVTPHEVISYSVRSMEPLANRVNVTVELSLEPDLPPIYADKDKLIQVLINLLSNAIKFTPANGLVQIHCRKIVDPATTTTRLLISVSDTGEGIKPDHLDKLFEKYQQVGKKKTRLVKGTGLGLFIVRELVEAHHGNVAVVSHYGHGSCFSLLFPITESSTA